MIDVLPAWGVLHTEEKHKISETLKILLDAHYKITDPSIRVQRYSDAMFAVHHGDSVFRVTVQTVKIVP